MSYNIDQDVGYNINQIEALNSMFQDCTEEDTGHVYGSALNPSSLHHGNQKKELAKPNVEVEVKLNNRNATGGAIISEEDQKRIDEGNKKEEVKKTDKDDIWTEEEINIKEEERPDDRPQPDFDVLFKQHVGTEDIFLGLSDRDPSSTHCDSLLVKVKLPGTKFAHVQLDVKGITKQ